MAPSDHVITINEDNRKELMANRKELMANRIASMANRMKEPPKLLHKLAGKKSCCIFRVPQSLVEINEKAYRPRTVSIGPYHYGNEALDMIQQHKWRFLNDLITRSGHSLAFFMDLMVLMESQIRESYSESIELSTDELAEMMVLDGVFLIELFRKVGKLVATDKDDPIFKMVWLFPSLMRDLLKIENQIPFSVLQKLFDASSTDTVTLQTLILKFFSYLVVWQPEVFKEYENQEAKHLLDFFRTSFVKTTKKSNDPHTPPPTTTTNTIPSGQGTGEVECRQTLPQEKPREAASSETSDSPSVKLIPPATKLVSAGVKFEAKKQAKSFLDIEFQKGVLSIPQISMDAFYSSFFLNCVAFEQCYCHCSKDITTYVVFMGCLMNTSTDVGLLSEKKIIENYFGIDKKITKFFKNVGKDVAFDISNNYLTGLFTELNSYCNNGWHVGFAGFKHTYFSSPWVAISALAAFMLLSLAALQTFFTVFPTHK